MKLVFAFLFVLMHVTTVRADDVFLKNGNVYKNVSTTIRDEAVIVNFGGREDVIYKNDILKIINVKYEQSGESTFGKFSSRDSTELNDMNRRSVVFAQTNEQKVEYPQIQYEYKNSSYAAAGILSGIVAWICFGEASDQSDAIDATKKLLGNQTDVHSMESRRNRYSLLGVLSSTLGIGCIIYGAIPVEITASPNSVQLSYKF